MREGRPASFYWLALFFGLFVLFLYGPMIAIFVLSFQGPEGGLTIVQLIAATTTAGGLKVRCELDPSTYPAGIKVSDAEMESINLKRHDFHGEWNYTINPRPPAPER